MSTSDGIFSFDVPEEDTGPVMRRGFSQPFLAAGRQFVVCDVCGALVHFSVDGNIETKHQRWDKMVANTHEALTMTVEATTKLAETVGNLHKNVKEIVAVLRLTTKAKRKSR